MLKIIILEFILFLICLVSAIGLIRIHYSMKTPEWLTSRLISKTINALWIAFVIVSMIMAIIYFLPATIDP